MPVGGSRHYQGGGLGQVGLWACPSCGEDNTGKLEQGCVHCGAGVPREPVPPPTPPVPQGETDRELTGGPGASLLDEWQGWRSRYPNGTAQEAFTHGYVEGFRAARRLQLAEQARVQPPPQPEGAPMLDHPQTYRTIVAALAFFRDQILATNPEEVATGEWLSAGATTNVIDHLQQLLGNEREVTRV